MKKQLTTLLFSMAGTIPALAQGDSAQYRSSPLTFTGFVEVYYGYDFGQPANHKRPSFVYSHNRHNEININLAFVKGSYVTAKTRANLAIAAGTYMNANYGNEPGVLKNIYEANAGVKLSKSKQLWIDAGVMPSHIGFESAYSPDCWTLTRSMIADNSPYFESGVKLGYTSDNGRWYLAALVLNGWQRISRPNNNNTPTGGTQITFTPSDKVRVNYSTFVGSVYPDRRRRYRFFNNLYTVVQATDKLGIIAGVDYGLEQRTKNSSRWNTWLGSALLLRYQISDKTAFTARGEYYLDEKKVIINTRTRNGFNTTGWSVCFDYKILSNALWRIEGKMLNSKDAIFRDWNNKRTNDNFAATTSLSIAF